jgi:nucleoside-diphosphate-sugar epimerase
MKDKKQQNNRLKKVLLLTGATGYLGSSLLRVLVKSGCYKIIVLKRSFSNTFRINELLDKVTVYDIDTVKLEDVFKNNKIDTVLHCATDYGRKNTSVLHIIEANLILPVTLLELGENSGVRCFINTDTILDKRVSCYSLSKKQFKDWLLNQKDKMVCVNIALEHFFGPGDDKTKFVSFVVDSLLKKVESIDFTKGEQKRDFIFIDDVTRAFMKIVEHSNSLKNGFYNFEIGTNKAVTIKEFILLIKRLTKNKTTVLNFGALPYRENEVMEGLANSETVRKLGWVDEYSLEDGLMLMIEQELQFINK